MFSNARAHRLAAGVGLVVGIDLATKTVASSGLAGSGAGFVAPVHNAGLSLGTVRPSLLIVIALGVAGLAVAVRLTFRSALRGSMPLWIPACLVGGGLANLVDRAAFGAVHDFIATPWLVLNVADLAVFAGLAALCLRRRSMRITR